MNNKKYFLFTLILLFTSNFTKAHTGKTFLLPRSANDDLATKHTGWYSLISKTKKTDLKCCLQATGFYQKSTNKSKLGKYFGYHAIIENVDRDYIHVDNSGATAAVMTDKDALWAYYLVHIISPGTYYPVAHDAFPKTNFSGKIKLEPKQENFGLKLNYYQNLNFLIKKLFFELQIPIEQVKNSLNPKIISSITAITTDRENYSPNFLNILDYFAGNIENLNNGESLTQQYALQKAKIKSGQSKTSVADINAKLGYYLLNKKRAKIDLAITFDIPTGTKAKGDYLFEPIVGNGHHWALGGAIDSYFTLIKNKDFKFIISPIVSLKYLFENTEKRTLGLQNNSGNLVNMGQYYLGGQVGQGPVFPLANVLTRDVKITPGFICEGLLNLTFKFKPIIFDIGYNLYLKQKESVKIKNWDENLYGVAKYDYDTSGEFAINDGSVASEVLGAVQAIKLNNINLNSAKTPSQFTNKIYAGLGLWMSKWKIPVYTGLGASYEFVNKNSAIENYELWCKLGLAF